MLRHRTPTPIPFTGIVASALTLLVAGLVSVAYGQDANWDLRNYHLYGPWALFTGRLGTDLGAAGISGYVNPALDLPYYLIVDRLPPRVVAFVMGALQGTNALLLYRLARRLLPVRQGRLVAFCLALGGCLGSVFLSEFGSTMGDNVTAALVLAALLLGVGSAADTRWTRIAAAGAVAGVATGLKLTNAPYAVGLCLALLLCGGAWPVRLRRGVACAAGCALGFVLSYGYWAVTLWTHFANPFYPQFNRLFASPLAAATLVVDNKWHPDGWLETLLFPFSFSAFPMRIHEVPLVDPLWPVVYPLFIGWLIVRALRRSQRTNPAGDALRETGVDRLFVFAAVGYLLWMGVFSIGRYLVTIELLLPLLTWLLLHRLVRARIAMVAGSTLILVSALFPLVVHFTTWGTADFAATPYAVDVPTIADPAHTTVLVLTAPVAWIFPRFPPELAYLGLDRGYPESPGYLARVDETLKRRGGPVFAILPSDNDAGDSAEVRLNKNLARFGIDRASLACRYVAAILAHRPGSDIVIDDDAADSGTTSCTVKRDSRLTPMFARDARAIAASVAAYGFAIDVDRCTIHDAAIGTDRFRYRFCPVMRTATD